MQNKSYKGFSKIDKLITATAKDRNFEQAFYKHKTIKYWNEVASAFVVEAKEFTQAIDFKKGILTVACLSKEVASKLRVLADRIISALNQLVGRQVVYAIYIEV